MIREVSKDLYRVQCWISYLLGNIFFELLKRIISLALEFADSEVYTHRDSIDSFYPVTFKFMVKLVYQKTAKISVSLKTKLLSVQVNVSN